MRPLSPLPEWLTLEHQVAQILTEQEEHGWYFDESSARELESTLRREYEETTQLLRNRHPYVEGPRFCPKRTNKRTGYVEGAPLTKLKELNPTSRDHIAWILQTHYGWTPSLMTSTGKPVIDETVLKDVGTGIALQFLTLLDLTKKLGMISEGVNAWQKLVTTSSRIHHHCSVATSTFRCAHRKPNLAQVPSDERFRKLFTATPGRILVGADLSGIELRMLAHYLARFDQGRYTRILTTGDIHATNAERIGITRSQVKTVTYAFLYGAGDTKIGHSYDKQLSEEAARKKGREIRKAYVDAIPGLKELLEGVHKASERGYVYGLDHRRILVDSRHKSLNYLIQGSSATVAKRWLVLTADKLRDIKHERYAFVHDEQVLGSPPSSSEDVAFACKLSAIEAGEYYKIRLPIEADANIGDNWAEVH